MKSNIDLALLILAILALFSLGLSIWMHYGNQASFTGLAIGTINVTINESVGITLSRAAINFTVSNPGDSRVTYTAADLTSAPLSACNSMMANQTCGINITNDGSVNINVTLRDLGSNIFSSGSFARHKHFLFNVSVPISARNTICPNSVTNGFYNVNNTHIMTGGYVPTINWTPVNTSAITIICGLNFSNTGYSLEMQQDVASIDFNITVPTDEPAGTKGTILVIESVRAGL